MISFEDEKAKVDKGRYQRLVGNLIYSEHTRPYLTYPMKLGNSCMIRGWDTYKL